MFDHVGSWPWGAGLFHFFYTQHGRFRFRPKKKQKKCAKKNAILGILRKFQTAVPPKVLGIRANP